MASNMLVRGYFFSEVNKNLYINFAQTLNHRDNYTIQKLLYTQNEQSKILKEMLNILSIQKPDVPEKPIRTDDDHSFLFEELKDRENETAVIFDSYWYSLVPYYSFLTPSIYQLQYLQREKMNLLAILENTAQTLTTMFKGQNYWLEDGYELQRVVSELTFPTSIVFDDEGEIYVGEAGYSYGPTYGKARIVHISEDGNIKEIANGFDPPLTGIAWYQGFFYVITGSSDGKVYRVSKTGEKEVIISGLRGGADHFTSEIVIGPDGKIYFGVGTTTNSGVVGPDNDIYGWLTLKPRYHDVPARDYTLVGQNFESDNPLTKTKPKDKVKTGALHPFGSQSYPGETIKGSLLANGVLYRANLDGSGLEIIADGLRNVFGLGFSPDGKLFATNNGFDFRGSRPIEGDWDTLYEVKKNGWYGWPDYASGLPVTLPYFKPSGHPQPKFLLSKHFPVEQPLIRFKPHSATQKFDFNKNQLFGEIGEMFFAQFGSAPFIATASIIPKGFRIVRAMPYSGRVKNFYINLVPGKQGDGPERPLALRFSPDGNSLYIIDFGVLLAAASTPIPYANTGALWKITKK